MFRGIVRASSFLRKEIFEILRQPRLVLTLVLGPFLILLAFGIGYRNEPRALRTLFVAPKGSALYNEIQQYASTLGPQLIYEGVTDNQNEALQKLRTNQVDLVAVAPPDAYQTIRNNQQATFILYHNEIDPLQVQYVQYFGQVYVDEVNRRVLMTITSQGQNDASRFQSDLQAAHASSNALRTALQNNDAIGITQHKQELNQNVNALTLAAGASLGLLSGVQQTLGPGVANTGQSQGSITDLQQSIQALNNPGASPQDQIASLDKIDKDLTYLDSQLSEFQSISPSVIVSPFNSETKSIASIQPSAMDFFAPAVLALLLQHLAVTFAALSIVRERTSGTMELFRVSPLSAAEALLGKYISYLVIGGVIAAALSALLVFVLHVPMLGNWWVFALVVFAVLFTSLGIGFVISIVSQTDSQAVQYSMIVLLASIFFSGFIMSLDMIWQPVQVISWALPTTYGSILLRDIALRGLQPNYFLLAGLLAIGIALLILAWYLLGKLIARAQR